MTELLEKTPCAGLLPVQIGDMHLREVEPGPFSLLLPMSGTEAGLNEALQKSLSLRLPEPGRFSQSGEVTVIWFGRAQWMLAGAGPEVGLGDTVAVSEQSDAWAVVELEGSGARDVLARLCPVDLRVTQFIPGQVARTELQHMSVALMCIEEQRFRIFAFRSMAHTLVHDLTTAMRSVDAQLSG